jgi:hypothetical protein
MSILPRSEIIQPGDTVMLRARFVGPDGNEVDLDTFPTVSVIQPSGGVSLSPTSVGVMRIGVGQYSFNYNVGLFPPIGTWRDVWTGVVDGFSVMNEFTFTVFQSQLPSVNTDGEVRLDDEVGYNFSQTSICNINNLLKSLKFRLKSSGKAKRTDEFGNIIYKDCDVYNTDELVGYIVRSLSRFNQTPTFTSFTFEDTCIIEEFHDILVQGAVVFALGAQALIERGREYAVTDNGVAFSPPSISELLMNQYNAELADYKEALKTIKVNMKPNPLGLGVLTFTNTSSQFRRLRNLRARQIY